MHLNPIALPKLQLDKLRNQAAEKIIASETYADLDQYVETFIGPEGSIPKLLEHLPSMSPAEQLEFSNSVEHTLRYLRECVAATRDLLDATAKIQITSELAQLSSIETEYLGRRNGRISSRMRLIPTFGPDERPAFGDFVNKIKVIAGRRLEEKEESLRAAEETIQLKREAVDVTRPGRVPAVGRQHPLTRTFERVADIMVGLGFQQVDGPEVEDYAYNFAALNFQEEHPALDEQASFYVTESLLLRTHTTGMQGRVMPTLKPPFRIFTHGRCFRYEAVDATHYHTFHQIDAFMVAPKVSLADLKGTLAAIMRELFGPDATVRFRPDYFPFVEPGVEVAVKLPHRWMEIGGAGMIHPNVLRHVGIDPNEWSGFAFGLGLDRMPMVRHGIGDIRLLFENDLRMLKQF